MLPYLSSTGGWRRPSARGNAGFVAVGHPRGASETAAGLRSSDVSDAFASRFCPRPDDASKRVDHQTGIVNRWKGCADNGNIAHKRPGRGERARAAMKAWARPTTPEKAPYGFPSLGPADQTTRRTSSPSSAPSLAILSATCPTPMAQWCAGPAFDHSFMKALAPMPNW